jgi:UDP-N-acetyl-D-galactosamine dehydrogenase
MRTIAVHGLGYVGLPVALAFARRFPGTIGYDHDRVKIERLRSRRDPTGAVTEQALAAAEIHFTADPAQLARADFHVLCLPTPIDAERRPDLSPLLAAARTLGAVLKRGDVVVVESTVYPGATEERVAPLLASVSGLAAGADFHIAYSPERINPGDPEHAFERVRKVVAADDAATLAVVEACYGAVVPAGLYRAPSIRVAEAAKVIENVQRDLNIALVNELAMLCDRMGLDTRAVLAAAATKWNFHAYHPGLVGGHCIGVDPYYLTSKAEALGFHPEVILAGRRTNDGMGAFVGTKTVRLLSEAGREVRGARVAVLGLAFKPEVPDARNSRVPDVVRELRSWGAEVLVHDPLVDPAQACAEHGIKLVSRAELTALDALVLATPHRVLLALAHELVRQGCGVVVDVLGALAQEDLPALVRCWRL